MAGVRIDPYEREVTASGAINGRPASAADFGGEIAQGFGSIGAGLSEAASTVNRIEEDQGRIWASTAVSQKELELRQQMEQQVNSMDPTAQDYPARIASLTQQTQDQIKQAQNDLMEQAPGRFSKRFVAYHMASAGLRLNEQAMNVQSKLNADYTKDLVQSGVKADSDLLAASPDNDTYARLIQKQHDSIAGLTTIPPQVKSALIEGAAHTYAQVQAASVVARDPQAFLQLVNAQGGQTTAAGVVRGQVPTIQNFNADFVKPYSSDQVRALAGKVQAPSQYDELFKQAGAKYGVNPAELKMRAVVESGLNPSANSGQAQGLMQLSPAKAAELGVNPMDPAQAVDGAAKLLAQYQSAAKGDSSAVDKMYYGGESIASWGPNTKQYAANLSALRAAMGAGPVGTDPQVQPLDDQSIAQAKVPLAGWDKLTWPEKVSYVRQAEAQVGKGLAEDRGALSRELKDANASLLAGQNYPGLDSPRYSAANLIRVFGPDVGARAAQELQYNVRVGQFMQGVSTMPAAQRDATLEQLAPQAGEGFAEAQQSFKVAEQAARNVEEQQLKAPIQTAIVNGIGGAQPLDFSKPDTLAGQLYDRTKVAATMQRDFGTSAQIFTADEVNQLADRLGNMSGRDRIGLLGSIRVGLNDSRSFSVAMNQLAPKNPTLAYAANLAAKDNPVYIDGKAQSPADVAATIADGDIILNGRSLDKQMAKGDDPAMPNGSKAVRFDDSTFRQIFGQAVANGFQSPDAQRSAAQEMETYNAAKAYYVARAYQQGKDLGVIDTKEVNNAIQAVIGTPWRGVGGGGTLFAPYGMPIEKFQSQWPRRAAEAVKAAGYSDEDAQRILDKTVPVNLADGRYGFQNGTRLQTDSAGRPIVVDYRKPYVEDQVSRTPPEMSYSNSLPMMRRY